MIAWLSQLDPQLLLVGFTLAGALAALPFVLLGFARLWDLRLVSGGVYLLIGGFFAVLGVALALLAASLYTYQRLTQEQLAGKAALRQLGERHFLLSLQVQGQPPRSFELRGDEWQIDARVLKWGAWGSLAGLDTVYRLERLGGRYTDVAQERSAPRTVYGLAPEGSLDLWAMLRKYQAFLPFTDALYGSAAYVPMADGAEYAVSVSASGLVVRPENDAARKAVSGGR